MDIMLRYNEAWFGFISHLGLFFGLTLVVMRSRNSDNFVALHQNGIRFRLKTKRVNWLLYQSISGLQEELVLEQFLFIPIRKRYSVYIAPQKGKTFCIPSSINNLPELYANLANKVNPTLKPMVETAFVSGKWVKFGEVIVNQSHLRYRNRLIPLEQVNTIAIHSGKFQITKKSKIPDSKWFQKLKRYSNPDEIRIPLSKVFNLEILLELFQTRIRP